MMAGNESLARAAKVKNHEFYTQWADIEREMNAYLESMPTFSETRQFFCPVTTRSGATSPSTSLSTFMSSGWSGLSLPATPRQRTTGAADTRQSGYPCNSPAHRWSLSDHRYAFARGPARPPLTSHDRSSSWRPQATPDHTQFTRSEYSLVWYGWLVGLSAGGQCSACHSFLGCAQDDVEAVFQLLFR